MLLAKVRGTVVATIKHAGYANRRMLLLDRIDAAGQARGGYLVAVDAVDAVAGQIVLVVDEGNSARQIVADDQAPIRSVIIGIVDDINL